VVIIAARWSPLMVTSVTGEIVPFAKAALISTTAMFPIGIISGWLFPLVTRRIIFPASDAVVKVYLYEGIGAFAGGLIISLLVLMGDSTFVIGVTMSVIVMAGVATSRHRWMYPVAIIVFGLYVLIGMNIVWVADWHLEELENADYEVESCSYSPYGKHLILDRDDNLTLMTDNNIEAIYPDRETAENHFIVPLIYNPSSGNIIYTGQGRFITASLKMGTLPDTLIAIDPRGCLARPILEALRSKLAKFPRYLESKNNDAVDYFASSKDFNYHDIIILNSGLPDNYGNSRYFTPRFLQSVKSKMADSSILSIPLAYDTDRYITPEMEQVISIIYATLSAEFANVTVWPGTTTIFLASDRLRLDLTYDEIIGRLDEHNLSGDYISDAYLFDRLSEMKVDRLHSAISGNDLINTTEKPILTHYQALYRSTAHPIDRGILSAILGSTWWTIIIPAGVLIFFIMAYRSRYQERSSGLFLYFTAGVVSLSLELLSFYLYQTMAGSLYSEMSLLIGSFMLGLAVGTYYAHKVGDAPLEYPALIILLVSTIIFLTTWDKIGTDALLPFHILFLFVVAVATGTLFVGATNIYYGDDKQTNRGIGYAWELAGSALGALLTLTILLPIIGLTWLLISLAILIILALVGSVLSNKPMQAY
jgi:hypothetical protein